MVKYKRSAESIVDYQKKLIQVENLKAEVQSLVRIRDYKRALEIATSLNSLELKTYRQCQYDFLGIGFLVNIHRERSLNAKQLRRDVEILYQRQCLLKDLEQSTQQKQYSAAVKIAHKLVSFEELVTRELISTKPHDLRAHETQKQHLHNANERLEKALYLEKRDQLIKSMQANIRQYRYEDAEKDAIQLLNHEKAWLEKEKIRPKVNKKAVELHQRLVTSAWQSLQKTWALQRNKLRTDLQAKHRMKKYHEAFDISSQLHTRENNWLNFLNSNQSPYEYIQKQSRQKQLSYDLMIRVERDMILYDRSQERNAIKSVLINNFNQKNYTVALQKAEQLERVEREWLNEDLRLRRDETLYGIPQQRKKLQNAEKLLVKVRKVKFRYETRNRLNSAISYAISAKKYRDAAASVKELYGFEEKWIQEDRLEGVPWNVINQAEQRVNLLKAKYDKLIDAAIEYERNQIRQQYQGSARNGNIEHSYILFQKESDWLQEDRRQNRHAYISRQEQRTRAACGLLVRARNRSRSSTRTTLQQQIRFCRMQRNYMAAFAGAETLVNNERNWLQEDNNAGIGNYLPQVIRAQQTRIESADRTRAILGVKAAQQMGQMIAGMMNQMDMDGDGDIDLDDFDPSNLIPDISFDNFDFP
ncbi:MAG: hypothetical protein AB7F64_09175, partial [Gammaproteobacteria bacterium]